MKFLLILFLSISSLVAFSQSGWIVQSPFYFGNSNTIYYVNSAVGFLSAGVSPGISDLYRTIDGGLNWSYVYRFYTMNTYSIDFLNKDTGWVSGFDYSTFLYRTTNGGVTWNYSTNIDEYNGGTIRDIDYLSYNTGWAVGFTYSSGDGYIRKTTDGGTWTKKLATPSRSVNSVFFIDSNTGWAVGDLGLIVKSTNSGDNWQSITLNTDTLIDLEFINPNTGWCISKTKLYKTTNGGGFWSFTHADTNMIMKAFTVIDENTGYAVGFKTGIVNEGKIKKTTNGGSNWIEQQSYTNNFLNDVSFSSTDMGWIVGNNGSLLRTYTGGEFTPNTILLNLRIALEGVYWNSVDRHLRKDTVTAYLHNTNFPYSRIDSSKIAIDSLTFSGVYRFNNAPSGTYYISVKHFQSIETWSKSGGEVLTNNGSIYNYDFTTSSSKAYGSNLKLKGSKYCIYSGDLNQSGFVDATELSMVENDAAQFVTGRLVLTDINGDEIVDASDYLIVDNNAYNFIGIIRP
jgi:photosystem II stability/assembly factor-like uncharacterized protein